MNNNAKLHSCENCGIDFEYENGQFSAAYVNNRISCPSCGAGFYYVYNYINDFTYLEYIGLLGDLVKDYEYGKNNFLFKKKINYLKQN